MGWALIQRVLSIPVSSFLLMQTGFGISPETALLIERGIQKHTPEIVKARRLFHMNPELAYEEHKTSSLIASKLLFLGLDVRTGVATTGVVGLLRGSESGPTIGIRACMDASPIQEASDLPFRSLYPGRMHACGHDIQMAIALGTAMVLADIRDRISGNITFIFQPAEEGAGPGKGSGAQAMIQEGVLENPAVQAVLGLHVWPEDLGHVFLSPGVTMASSDWFRVTLSGKSADAARPHEGIDTIVLASQVILGLQSLLDRTLDPTDPAVLSLGKIQGGTKAQMLADRVELEGTIRTLSKANRAKIPGLIEDFLKAITQPFGATYSFQYTKGCPPLYNHPDLVSLLRPTLTRLLGEDHVVPIPPQMISDNFSYFCQKIPGLLFFLGVKNPEEPSNPPLYSPRFQPDERSIPLGIRIMCHLTLDVLEQQRQIEENLR